MKKNLVLLGYILMLLGFLAIILSMVGINLSFLAWLESFGRLPAFLIKLMMIIFGIIIMYVSKTNQAEYL